MKRKGVSPAGTIIIICAALITIAFATAYFLTRTAPVANGATTPPQTLTLQLGEKVNAFGDIDYAWYAGMIDELHGTFFVCDWISSGGGGGNLYVSVGDRISFQPPGFNRQFDYRIIKITTQEITLTLVTYGGE